MGHSFTCHNGTTLPFWQGGRAKCPKSLVGKDLRQQISRIFVHYSEPSLDIGPRVVYNGSMKDNLYNLDLPIFILGSFMLVCFGSAIGIIIQALTGTL